MTPIEESDEQQAAIVRIITSDKMRQEKSNEWTFELANLHCRNREMLERLFAGCQVTVSVDAMVDLHSGSGFHRSFNMIETSIELPPFSNSGPTPTELLMREEERIQAEAEIYLKELYKKEGLE